MDFLTNRPRSVRLGNHISSTFILNTGVPQGCVLSPLLYSLFIHGCVPRHNSNIFIKYADDTTVVGLISNNDKLAYREEIQSLSAWCSMNNLTLDATKTKELIVDFQKSSSNRHSPIYINGSEVERVSSFKFLGVHISEDLSWHQNTSTLVRKDAASLLPVEDGPNQIFIFAGTCSASLLIGGGDRRLHLPPSLWGSSAQPG
ncbi:hypothetical protein QTP86_005536 [Hemibagrus guttatus]|nr:hypothetical protein QTP86_005536 [Hemibagrus guttatus]